MQVLFSVSVPLQVLHLHQTAPPRGGYDNRKEKLGLGINYDQAFVHLASSPPCAFQPQLCFLEEYHTNGPGNPHPRGPRGFVLCFYVTVTGATIGPTALSAVSNAQGPCSPGLVDSSIILPPNYLY